MALEFNHSAWLLLLIPLAAHLIWMSRRLRLLSPARRRTVVLIRLLILILLVGALAEPRRRRDSDELTVLFVLDESRSIPEPHRQEAEAFIRQKIDAMGLRDRAGLIRFGAGGALHHPPSPSPEFEEARTLVDPSRTNVAEALELAMACFLRDTQKRIVLLSDGNQNVGDAAGVARGVAAAGIVIDVLPLRYKNRNDVILEKVLVENRVSLDEPFDLRVVASARAPAIGRLSIHQDGRLIGQFDVDLEAERKNVFVVPTQVRDAGFHTFEAQLDSEGDAVPENNRGFTFTYGEGEPRALLVDGDLEPSPALAAMLESEGVRLERVDATGFPHSARDLQSYDAVIFNNVAAAELSGDQMTLLARAVEDLGLGFIMIGGENSFGAGGYNDSPVERVLPVYMELKNTQVLPQGALVPIIHTVEIPQGQYWSEQVTLAALNVLSPRDLMGVLYYSWQGGEKWLFPLQEVGGKSRLRSMIKSMQPGDMPSFDRTLQMAYNELADCGASVRHIVVISDGDPQTPNPTLVKKIQAAGITISTICINPHSPRDTNTMRQLASVGGGNFYHPQSYNTLPQIFTREAATVRKALIFDEPFTPRLQQSSPVLTGIDTGYPQLGGYVGASPKDLADVPLVTENGDPLLAHWRQGLGKTAAFTSDAKERWATNWLEWSGFSKFWTQLVRWCLRPPANPDFQVEMTIEGTTGKVVVDAVDSGGNFINFLELDGTIVTPSMESRPIELRQKAPGRYEADFEVSEAGAYMLGAEAFSPDGNNMGLLTGGASLSYSPEFKDSSSDERLLYQLADLSGGRVLDATMPVFDHDLASHARPIPLWPAFLLIALLLYLVDVFARRVLIGWGDVAAAGALAWQWARRRWKREAAESRPTEDLLRAREEVRAGDADFEEKRQALLAQLQRTRTGESPLVEMESKPSPKPVAAEPEPEPAPPPAEEERFTSDLLKARREARDRIDKRKERER